MAGAATAFFSPSFLLPSHKLHSNPRTFPLVRSSSNFSPTSQKPSIAINPATRFDHIKMKVTAGQDGKEISEGFYDSEEEIDDEEEEEEEESSIDLLFRFLQTVLRKISKKVKKATRSVLPPSISPQLVSFAVDGVLLLTGASIAKALLEALFYQT